MPKKLNNGMTLRIIEAVIGVIMAAAIVGLWSKLDTKMESVTKLEVKVERLEKDMQIVILDAYGVDRSKE